MKINNQDIQIIIFYLNKINLMINYEIKYMGLKFLIDWIYCVSNIQI